MSICTVCGRCKGCDHNTIQRDQSPEEMNRPLNKEEEKVLQDYGERSPQAITIAKKNAKLPVQS